MNYPDLRPNKSAVSDAVNDTSLKSKISIEDFTAEDLGKALQNSLCAIALIRRNGSIKWSNDVWDSYGDLSVEVEGGILLNRNLQYLSGKNLFEQQLDEKLFDTKTPVTAIIRCRKAPLKRVFMMRFFGPMGSAGEFGMMQVLDISAIHNMKSVKTSLHTIINGSSEPLFILNSEDYIIATNNAAAQLLGTEPNLLLKQPIEPFFSLDTARNGMDSIRDELVQHGWWEGTLKFSDSRGAKVVERVSAYRIGGTQSSVRHIIIVRSHNLENTQESESETTRTLRKLGLPNRKSLELQIDLATDTGQRFGLLYLSLNQSGKELTQNVPGKPAVIKQVLESLKSKLPEGALITALTGSEFAVLINSIDAASLEKIARKLRDTVRSSSYSLPSTTLFLNLQIGIVMSGNVFQNAEEYLIAAKTAAESAREANLHNIKVVDPLDARRQKGIEGLGGKLKRALHNNEFFPVYEPFVDLKTMQIVGCEALVRWNCEENGIMRPGEFLPAIEAHGLMEELTEILFFRACRDFGHWLGEGLSIQTLSLNVTARDVDPEFLPSLVNRALHHSKLPDNLLQIEITEEGLVNHNKAITVIKALRDRGVRVAIDDFGTGYSNLAYLKTLPVDALKIDRTFVMESTRDAGSRALIESINFLGKKLGLQTISEGIESSEQRDLMSVVGCDLGQGYLFSTPKPARRFRQLLIKS